MSVVSEIERIKNEVNSQSAIIDEISTILDSKASSSDLYKDSIMQIVEKKRIPGKSINIPEGVVYIAPNSIYLTPPDDPSPEQTTLNLANSIQTIMYNSIWSDDGEVYIPKLPDNLKTIESHAITFVSMPENMVFPKNISLMQEEALDSIVGMRHIWLSQNIETIEANFFVNCNDVEDVYTDAVSRPTGWDSQFYFNGTIPKITVHYNVSEEDFLNMYSNK